MTVEPASTDTSPHPAVLGGGPAAQGLRAWCAEQDLPGYRVGQVLRWIVQRRATDFAAMTDLPAELRARLADRWKVLATTVRQQSKDADGTRKLLLGLEDGQSVECVLISQDNRRTVCLSTQVGCAMGCVFCASGMDGVERNLRSGEMIEELLRLQALLPRNERLSHIVVMGMGEPLANLGNLLPVLDFATAKDGLGIGARNVTVSTVGLPPGIRKLAASGKPYHLAVSLHAPDDELRRRIVPVARRIALADVIAAADEFRETTGRQVTFEYVLLGGVNDGPQQADRLAHLLRGRDALVNLIPYNPVAELPYVTPTAARSADFARRLKASGLTVKTRKRQGAGVDAACGQLRRAAGPSLVTLAT